MRTAPWRCAAIGGLLLLAGAAHADGIQWVKSFSSALSQAKASNKLVMADFYADW